MNRWKRWKRTLQLIFNPTTRQIAAAIRLGETKERNRAKREAQNKPDVWIDKALQAQAQAQICTYEPPEKHTDPSQLARLGIRRRAMTRQLQENKGLLMNHHKEMLAKKAQAANDPETAMLPSVTAPEDDWINGGADQTIRTQATKP